VAAREGRNAKRPVYSHHLRIVECLRVHDLAGALQELDADLSFPPGLPDYEEVIRGTARAVPSRPSRGSRKAPAKPRRTRHTREAQPK
jgi:hypothetical protein